MPGQEWNDQQHPFPCASALGPSTLDNAAVPIRAVLDSALVRRDSGDSWELVGTSGRRMGIESDESQPSSRPKGKGGAGHGGMGVAAAGDPCPGRSGSGCPCTSGAGTDTRQRAGGTVFPAPVGTPFPGTAGSVLRHPQPPFPFLRPRGISLAYFASLCRSSFQGSCMLALPSPRLFESLVSWLSAGEWVECLALRQKNRKLKVPKMLLTEVPRWWRCRK